MNRDIPTKRMATFNLDSTDEQRKKGVLKCHSQYLPNTKSKITARRIQSTNKEKKVLVTDGWIHAKVPNFGKNRTSS